jgi:hypothetical protein
MTRLAILCNEVEDDHRLWVEACRELADRVVYEEVDLTTADWLERIVNGRFDGLLAIPGGWSTSFKVMYDERVSILHRVLGLPVFPYLDELLLYENKKYLAYWLAAQGIPHPRTAVFYHEAEALAHVGQAQLPLVAKTSVGASGDGVRILRSREEARAYVRRTFSGGGAPKRSGPKWWKKGFAQRVVRHLRDPRAFKARMDRFRVMRAESQKDFVILQEHVPHTYEWRAVRIGDSFFAHKKLVKGDKASGSLLKEYGDPPRALLDLLRDITERHGFRSQAIDVFETTDGRYLVNEMQCIFGQSDPHQMIVDGVPGRYVFEQGAWRFEPGSFNRIESFLPRLEFFLQELHARRSGRP